MLKVLEVKRLKVMRGFDTDTGCAALAEGFRAHYNLIRTHTTLGTTPRRRCRTPRDDRLPLARPAPDRDGGTVTRNATAYGRGGKSPLNATEPITEKVFERHYNQPTVKDRVERRDLLLGSDPSTREKDARIGALHRQVRKGEISQQEFDRELSRSLLAEATTPRRDDIDPAFA